MPYKRRRIENIIPRLLDFSALVIFMTQHFSGPNLNCYLFQAYLAEVQTRAQYKLCI